MSETAHGKRFVFITGGTGYLGRPLIAQLLARGHQVRALVRPGSESKVPKGVPLFWGTLSMRTLILRR